MTNANTKLDYSIGQKVLHWLIGIVIMLDLYIAQKFGGIMDESARFADRSDHALLGTIVGLLFIARLVLRWRNGAPALPPEMPDWQKKFAHLAHWALYFLIGMLVVTGIGTAMNANSIVAPLGLFAYGDGTGLEANFTTFRGLHEFATEAIITLIVLHVVAAVYHLVFVKDDVSQRMLKFWKSEKPN